MKPTKCQAPSRHWKYILKETAFPLGKEQKKQMKDYMMRTKPKNDAHLSNNI